MQEGLSPAAQVCPQPTTICGADSWEVRPFGKYLDGTHAMVQDTVLYPSCQDGLKPESRLRPRLWVPDLDVPFRLKLSIHLHLDAAVITWHGWSWPASSGRGVWLISPSHTHTKLYPGSEGFHHALT